MARFLILLFPFSLFLTSCADIFITQNSPDSPYPVSSTVKSGNLEGKRILIVGDSITTKTYVGIAGAVEEEFSECSVTTVGVGCTTYTIIGSEYKHLFGSDEMCYEICRKFFFLQQLKNAGNLNDYDIIFIQGGINDYTKSIPLDEFEYDVRKTLSYIKENFKGRVIVSLPPLYYYGINRTVYDANILPSHVNDYRKIIHQYAAYYGFELLNSTCDPHFAEFNSSTNYIDGLHPNEKGQKLFAKALHEIMN